MITFKEFLLETAGAENHIRQIASDARKEWMIKTGNKPTSRAQFGQCDSLSSHVATALQKHYSSATTTGQHMDLRHSYVKIPEHGLIVDPSIDQFHQHKNRVKKNGVFTNHAVYIGKMKDGHPYAWGNNKGKLIE